MKKIILSVLLIITSLLQAASKQDWEDLLQNGIYAANLTIVKKYVPLIIKADDKTRAGTTVLDRAQELLKKREEIVNYINSVANKPTSAQANSQDWDNLIKGLNTADLGLIKAIVPSKIATHYTTKGNREVAAIAKNKYAEQKKIYEYLNGMPAPGQAAHIPDPLEFYERTDPYYEFVNFYQADIKLDGKTWPTTEQYFQAGKFPNHPAMQEAIRAMGSARDAFNYARDAKNVPYRRQDWDEVKDAIMRKALYAKFTEHLNLQQLLLDTGNVTLVEASPFDGYWGYMLQDNKKVKYSGQNKLGRLLMELRTNLKKAQVPLAGQDIFFPQPENTTQSNMLIAAIKRYDLSSVQSIVPSSIADGSPITANNSLTPLQIAQYWMDRRQAIVHYFNSVQAQQSTQNPTTADWNALSQELKEDASLEIIQAIVPSKIAVGSKNKTGHSPFEIASYNLAEQKKVYDYLLGLAAPQVPSPTVAPSIGWLPNALEVFSFQNSFGMLKGLL